MSTTKIDKVSILQGAPVSFGSITIYQPTLKDINKISYDQFARITNLLTISESDLLLMYHQEHIEEGETNPILWLYENCLKNPTFFLELQRYFFHSQCLFRRTSQAPFIYYAFPITAPPPIICQIYSGAVIVNTRQAKRIAGAVHSKCPDLR